MRIQIHSEKAIFAQYKSRSKSKNIFFDLRFYEFLNIIKEECFYCGKNPKRVLKTYNKETKKFEFVYRNGIDRVDNDKGYIKGNCVSCCTRCNRMKGDMELEEFFERIARIYNLHIKK